MADPSDKPELGAQPRQVESDQQADSQQQPEFPKRKKHKRVVRRGGEKVLESEAVESFRLKDNAPHEEPKAQGGNDARLIADVPPHWGRQ